MSVNDMMVLRGRVGTNLTLSRPESGQGRSFSRFRMVVPRSRRRDDGQWEESEPQWYTVRAWGSLAENLAMSLRKGNPVVVVGRPSANAWIGRDGELNSELAVNALTVGHDLSFGAAFYRRVAAVRQPEQGGAGHAGGTGQSVDTVESEADKPAALPDDAEEEAREGASRAA